MEECWVGNNRSGAPRLYSEEGGFSLVELLIAMAFGLIVLGAMYNVFTIQNKTFSNQEDSVELQQSVRAGMDLMAKEIMMAGYNPASIANFVGVPVDTTYTNLTIRADLDANGIIAGQENVIYGFDSSNNRITRNIGSGALPLVENVQSFTFQYLDANGNVTATTANVRAIRITITGRTAKPDPAYPLNAGYRTYSLTSIIVPRNIGS